MSKSMWTIVKARRADRPFTLWEKVVQIIAWGVVGLLIGLLITRGSDDHRTEAPVSHPRIQLASVCTGCNPVLDRLDWIIAFHKGLVGHATRTIHYAPGFEEWYKNHARLTYHKAHPHKKFHPRVSWRRFTAHDNCVAVVMHGPGNLPGCGTTRKYARKMNRLLHDSAYWRNRSHRQNIWTNRVVLCGGSMVVIYLTGGTTAAAVGTGGVCYASIIIPVN